MNKNCDNTLWTVELNVKRGDVKTNGAVDIGAIDRWKYWYYNVSMRIFVRNCNCVTNSLNLHDFLTE